MFLVIVGYRFSVPPVNIKAVVDSSLKILIFIHLLETVSSCSIMGDVDGIDCGSRQRIVDYSLPLK